MNPTNVKIEIVPGSGNKKSRAPSSSGKKYREKPSAHNNYTANVLAEVDGEWVTTGLTCTSPAATIAAAGAIGLAEKKGWWH